MKDFLRLLAITVAVITATGFIVYLFLSPPKNPNAAQLETQKELPAKQSAKDPDGRPH